MFNHKSFSEGNYWFLKKQEAAQITSMMIKTNLIQQV
jgi:hypothetical protein